MSTHNIGFYEDLTKIIFELSSNTHLISSAGCLVFSFYNRKLQNFIRCLISTQADCMLPGHKFSKSPNKMVEVGFTS